MEREILSKNVIFEGSLELSLGCPRYFGGLDTIPKVGGR